MKAMRIGGRLRRLRQERRLTQAQMARELGISASYLTLLESNQRPVTVRVLLKLVEHSTSISRNSPPTPTSASRCELMEAFSDPVFESAEVKVSDVQELVATLPAIGRAVLGIYDAYRRQLPGDAQTSAGDDAAEAAPLDHPVRRGDRIHPAPPQLFPRDRDGGRAALGRQRPRRPYAAAGADRPSPYPPFRRCRDPPRRPDEGHVAALRPARRRLEISEMLSPSSRLFQIAHQIAYLGYHDLLDEIVTRGSFSSDEASALARTALANYFAGAVLMPYQLFCDAARSHPLRRRGAEAPFRRFLRAGLPSPDDAEAAGRRRRSLPLHPCRYRRQHLEALLGLRASTSPASAPPARAGTSTMPSARRA